MKRYGHIVIFLICVITGGECFAQASPADCLGAVPVCSTYYDVPTLPPNPNNVLNEINPTLSCLSNGEQNGVWYTFTVQTSGILSFNIIPYVSTTDYDWALFNLTNAECSDIATDGTLEVSCNYSNSVTNSGITGANGGPNNQDEPVVNVLAGETYVLYISNYSASQNGYRLDFGNSTASLPDNTIPQLVSAVPNKICGANRIILTFNENIACNSVSPSDFTLTGPSGPVTINTVVSTNCGSGGQYDNVYELTISPPLTQAGAYTLTMVGSVNDNCGNTLSNPPPIIINYNALNVNLVVTNANCGVDDGSCLAMPLGGSPPYTYNWSDGQATNPAVNMARGNYTVTVTDDVGCSVTLPFIISDPTSFTFTVQQTPDTCSKGVGVLTANVVGTTPPYIYNFNNEQNGPANIYTSATGDSTYIVRVTDNLGCWWEDTLVIINVLNDSLEAHFSVSDQEIDFLYPYASFYNESSNEDHVEWYIDGQTLYNNVFQYEFTDYGDFPVSLIAIDQNGCRDTFSLVVTVKVLLSLFIPNTITANDDALNEVFYVKGVGMDTTTFELWIFDRFGNNIFYTNDINQGWDGRSKQGVNINPQGTYAFRVSVKDVYGDIYEQRGMLNVIR